MTAPQDAPVEYNQLNIKKNQSLRGLLQNLSQLINMIE
jgi:hypothetical protein